jgi:Ca-activated chloride channel homolog
MYFRASLVTLFVLCLLPWPFRAVNALDQSKTKASGKRQEPEQKPGDKLVIPTHLVTVNVKVIDEMGRFVVGLSKDDFEIYDNGVRQDIAMFSDEDSPISLGFVYDVSGSMSGLTQHSLSRLRSFFDHSHSEDEFFLLTFNKKTKLEQDFTSIPENIINRAVRIPPGGSTSLYDAAYIAAEKVKKGRHQKKALLIFSDGMENSSRYTGKELRNMLKETDVQIYTIGFGDEGALREIAEPTGGISGSPYGIDDTEHFYTRLALMLRRQYVIGFYPSDTTRTIPWHKLHIKLNAPKQMRKLTLSYRKGYPAF